MKTLRKIGIAKTVAVCALVTFGVAIDGTLAAAATSAALPGAAGSAAATSAAISGAAATSAVVRGTHGVFSPDGRRIAFQAGDSKVMRVGVMTLATGKVEWLTDCGKAAYPAWGPEGSVVYAFLDERETAWAAAQGKSRSGCNLRLWKDGVTSQLTHGRWRDYAPSFSPDGKTIYYSSSEGEARLPGNSGQRGVNIRAVAATGGVSRAVAVFNSKQCAAVQPSLSPDGRLLAWSHISAFRDTWGIAVARVSAPDVFCRLTPPQIPAYAPRWMPDGRRIICTACREGDPGWCVYVLDVAKGEFRRLAVGENPDVSPDGTRFVYDRDGQLHVEDFATVLAAAPIFQLPLPDPMPPVSSAPEFNVSPERLPSSLPLKMSPGESAFYIACDVTITGYPKDDRASVFVRGAYAKSDRAFQLFVNSKGIPAFAMRQADGIYVGAHAGKKLSCGSRHRLVGVRIGDTMRFYVDGKLSATRTVPHGILPPESPKKLVVGENVKGSVSHVTGGYGWPPGIPRPPTPQDIFGDSSVSAIREGRACLGRSHCQKHAAATSAALSAGVTLTAATSAALPAGVTLTAATSAALPSGAHRAFEKIAIIDSFDFASVYDTETVAGNEQILDHVLLTGADSIVWRNCSGATMRYQSREESPTLMEMPLDPRRVPESRPVHGWLRYWGVEPDIVRTAFASCSRRGVAQGIHWPYEENHWDYWTLGPWNLSHPQYWCRSANGVPWHGRCSFSFPEVMAHKLRLLDELLDRAPQTIFFDLFRSGGWTVADEYVKPNCDKWRARYNTPPPDSRDPRWIALVGETQEAFFRAVRARIKARGMNVRILLGIDRVSLGEDENWVKHAVDWKKLVRDDVVDGIVVECVKPDPKRPFESTAEIYAAVREAMGGKPFYCPVMKYNFGGRPGYPWYCQATGMGEAEVVQRLLELARDAGAAGITMECVDYRNYSPAVCDTIRKFSVSDVSR